MQTLLPHEATTPPSQPQEPLITAPLQARGSWTPLKEEGSTHWHLNDAEGPGGGALIAVLAPPGPFRGAPSSRGRAQARTSRGGQIFGMQRVVIVRKTP